MRTEIDFGRYVSRLRNVFSQIIIKPMWLQLCLDIPDMQTVKDFQTCLQVQYKSYNLFEELMQIQLMDRRVEFIQNMKESMIDMDKEGNEIKYFASKFLVQKYLHLSDADIKLNEKYKQEEIDALNLAGGEDTAGDMGFESLHNELTAMKKAICEKLNIPYEQFEKLFEDTKKEGDEKSKSKSGKKTKKGKKKKDEEE